MTTYDSHQLEEVSSLEILCPLSMHEIISKLKEGG